MWKSSLCIGVDAIDRQHKVLFDKIEILLKEVRTSGIVHKNKCIDAITFLKEYTISHFAEEEEYQESINYADFKAHKKLHQRFIETIEEHEKIMTKSGFAVKDVNKFVGILAAWLLYHVSDADQRFAKNAGVSALQSDVHSDIVFFGVSSVLQKMAGFNPEAMKKVEINREPSPDSVSVKIEFTGDAIGHITITYPIPFIKELILGMLGFTPEDIGDLELSALFEVTSIIGVFVCGKIIKDKGIACDVKAPAVVKRTILPSDEQIKIHTGSGILDVALAISTHIKY